VPEWRGRGTVQYHVALAHGVWSEALNLNRDDEREAKGVVVVQGSGDLN
jgi:hypothetical protein